MLGNQLRCKESYKMSSSLSIFSLVRGSGLAVVLWGAGEAGGEEETGQGQGLDSLHHVGHGRGRIPQLGGVPEDQQ